MATINVERQVTKEEMAKIKEILGSRTIVNRYGVKRTVGITYDEILKVAECLNNKS